MIPAGRTAVDIDGIAELHGLSAATAHKRRPWNAPGHPMPLTRGRARRGHPRLWDRDQASAYANGQPIPPVPGPGDPLDLLDLAEAAELAGLAPGTWARYEHRERTRTENAQSLAPHPDAVICGTPHWYRRTVEKYRAERADRASAPRGGRPQGAADRVPRAEIAARVAELLDQAHEQGEQVNIAEIARTVGIHYATAHAHVRRLTDTPPD